MVVVVEEKRIGAPPDRVWAQVEPVERLPAWFEFAEDAELLGGEGLGRRQRIMGHWGKKHSEVDQVVTDHRSCRALAWRHEAERLDGQPAPRWASLGLTDTFGMAHVCQERSRLAEQGPELHPGVPG